ncbi:hypothetical protein CDD83_5082 [Cordyceps sp. RAO-2017]|nr:hypothetical protein CDD83_5082 [Cordyceps sp. RAO-2017]
MKLTVAALATLAAMASAANPYRLHFPRTNETAPAETRSAQPPLSTGSPSRPGVDGKYASSAKASPTRVQTAPGGADEVDSSTTVTSSSLIHKTVTRYVHASSSTPHPDDVKAAIPSDGDKPGKGSDAQPGHGGDKDGRPGSAGGLTTTTVTSKTTTTVVVSEATATATRTAGSGKAGPGDGRCSPATVTVTAPAVTSTVYVTVAPSSAGEPAPAPSKYPGGAEPCKAGRGPGCSSARPTTTLQSVVTVVPYPSTNGTHSGGTARPSGFARLRR